MSDRTLPAGEAARQLGISLDTLRRWDRVGRIQTTRDSANRRLVSETEISRIRGLRNDGLSARNRFQGVVREVRVEGLLAQVELDVPGPTRVTAVITRDAAEALGLLRPLLAVPIHWGTYAPLGLGRVQSILLPDPVKAFRREAAGIAPEVEVRVLDLGETLWLDTNISGGF